jgi:4-amino-4-deoxy-L-arabinose transferase-like glycosyltransferase
MKSKHFLLLLFILSFATRAGFLLIFGGWDNEIRDSMSDQFIYIDIGRNLAAGNGFTTSEEYFLSTPGQRTSITPPLYPIFLAGIFVVFGESLIIVRLLHIFFSFITVAITFWLGKQVFSEQVGRIASVIVLLHPAYIMFVRPIMSEGIYFAMVSIMALTAFLMHKYPKNVHYYAAFGIVSGLGFLTRTETIVGWAIVLAFTAFMQIRSRKIQYFQTATAVVSFGLLLLPVSIFNYEVHGSFSPFPNKRWNVWNYTLWDQLRQLPEYEGVYRPDKLFVPGYNEKTEIERDIHLYQLGMEWIKQNPVRFLLNRIKYWHHAYPIIPREELPVPIGYKGKPDKPDGYLYGPTSLDDIVRYLTPIEKARGWLFRLLLTFTIPGVYLILKNRVEQSYVFLLFLFWNLAHVFMFVGQERFRFQIEWIYVILAVYAIERLIAFMMEKRNIQSMPRSVPM